MKRTTSLLALATASLLLAACSQGQSAPPTVQTVNPGSTTYSKLQFAVGTANFANAAGASIDTAVNIVSTLRQPNGESAVLLDTPTLGGPFVLPAAVPDAGNGVDPYATIQDGGPSLQDFANNVLSGTSQTVHPGAPPCDTAGTVPNFTTCPAGTAPNTTTFGESGGVFGMGIQPANSNNSTTADSYVPYMEPIFPTAAVAAAGDAFMPWGGPPAFEDYPNGCSGSTPPNCMGTRDGLHNLGVGLLGWNQGITIVDVPPVANTPYTLNVQVPTGLNSQGQESFATLPGSATLTTTTPLPPVVAPALTLDGTGGGSMNVALPPGTEGYVQIVDTGDGGTNCQGALGQPVGPVYYTIAAKVSGTYNLPDTIGPNTTQNGPTSLTPSMSICTAAANTAAATAAAGTPTSMPGDSYTVQFFAMDYPLYEASYPANKSQGPTITNTTNGQSDITISAPVSGTSP